MKTTTTWKHGQAFESQLEQNVFSIDGNRKEGPNPKALLLSAIAACSGIDIVDILQKMRVQFSDLVIDVEAEQTTEHPRVFKDIWITYKLNTAQENEDKVRKAIDLSLEKYCGVSAMLRKNSPIHYKLELQNLPG
ncbi:MAG TPA: OsmC family protein [Chitinophagaceae bacterium]|nr:OsmC family protein [Chitinophagaceae bacterium]HUM65159.1 OsmC family protein [Chitinophagaceae bacterium]